MKSGVFAICEGQPMLGEIADLSNGGLSFRYDADNELPLYGSSLNLFSLDNNIQIRNLTIKTVWDVQMAGNRRKHGVKHILE